MPGLRGIGKPTGCPINPSSDQLLASKSTIRAMNCGTPFIYIAKSGKTLDIKDKRVPISIG